MTGPAGWFTQGVSTIRTRRQNLRRTAALLLAAVGAAGSLYLGAGITARVTGLGWRFPHVHTRPLFLHSPDGGGNGNGGGGLLHIDGTSTMHAQFPVTVSWAVPVPVWQATAAAVPLFLLWVVLQRRVFRRHRHPGPERHRGLAPLSEIRARYGQRAVRRTGAYTCPGTGRWQRFWLPTSVFGFRFGTPHRPHARRALWFDFEARVRIVARTGWGKSWRLLIPLIRQLPGAAVISSVEPEIFTATVKARMWRLPSVRWEWLRLLRRRWRTPVRHPVLVADLSDPHTRMAAGFDPVRWNPIVGCADFRVATNRAKALVSGGDTDGDFESSTDKFFRDSATQVLAAWLHAAALDPRTDIEDLVEWLRDTNLDTATITLRQQTGPGYTAARAAIMNMNVHLDPAAGRTTSGVRRYLNFAISSLGSGQGRALCGKRHQPQLDITALINAGGTVYLLAEVDEMDTARPLLTLFAQEMFLAAERAGRHHPHRRLPQTFMGVFDELHAGVRMPILPYVASVQRKYGISFAYAVQSSADEEALYGKAGAQRLRAQTHSIIGGYDAPSAGETTRRAGKTSTVTATRGTGGHHTEHPQTDDTLPEADQQQLHNGQSIIIGPGLAPFLAHTHRADHHHAPRKQIHREMTAVDRYVTIHRRHDPTDAILIDEQARGWLLLTQTQEGR